LAHNGATGAPPQPSKPGATVFPSRGKGFGA
jgi:hypothetical protein